MLLPNTFFSLENTIINPIFSSNKPVWTALTLLEGYLKSLKLGNIEVDIPAGVVLVNPELISIGKGSVIEPGAYIQGPCVIGENCTVRYGAYIRGNFLAGNNCIVGHDTEVKNSIFFNKAHAAHFNYIGDTILGSEVNMGAGSICSNLKLDNSNVAIFYENERIDTGLRKLGAILGDGCKIGCNAVLNPGTIFGKNVLCYPSINIGGYVAENSLVKAESKFTVLQRKSKKDFNV